MQIHQTGMVQHRIDVWKSPQLRSYEEDKLDNISLKNVRLSLEVVMISFALLTSGLLASLLVFVLEQANCFQRDPHLTIVKPF